ncbi:MAG: hypothetical protein JST85_10650 [Acidobacteria bacterium]|nr:hypothetical protein [Acidobacteriota bacterium]
MNQQTTETIDYLTSEDAEEDFFQFTDLSLTDEQLAEIKGGPGSGWCTQCGGIYSNHNETVSNDEELEAEPLDDLSAENDEQIVGGRMLNNKNPELTR